MARNGGSVLVKRNSKLEAFLKRNLDEDIFERVRAHEACVICSEKDDKKFKFIVLTDEWIYLTENPPRNIQEAVRLGDVVSIDLVNEFPDFLSGEERENTQHIVIKYMTKEARKGKRRKSKEKSNEKLAAKSSNGNLTYRGTLTARSSKGQLIDRKSQSLNDGASDVLHEARRNSLDAEVLRDALVGEAASKKKGSKNKKMGFPKDKLSISDNSSALLNQSLGSNSERGLPRPLPDPSEVWETSGELVDRRRKEALKLSYSQAGELRLALDKLRDDDVDDGTRKRTIKSPSKSLSGPALRRGSTGSILKKISSFGRDKPGSRRPSVGPKVSWSLPDTQSDREAGEDGVDGRTHLEEDDPAEWRRVELHIYILNYSSTILMLTRAAWNNFLIRETLEQDPDYRERTSGFQGPRNAPSEKFSILFTQLRDELLTAASSMEDVFLLINELKVGAERNFAIKKLFWKTPELFQFTVSQLKTYLPKSPVPLNADRDEDKEHRADELELVILMLEMLTIMLRETEILPERLQSLKVDLGKAVLDLLTVLSCTPDLLQKPAPTSPKTCVPLAVDQSKQWTCFSDAELCQLGGELTNVSTAVLSELMLIAHQANWADTNGSLLNICWMIQVVDDELKTMERYIERVLTEAMRLISPSRREVLQPEEAVRVYQQFSVLQTLIKYSPASATYTRDNFYEEFKYYIQAPVIRQKLPDYYPIASFAMRLIEEVMSHVLQKPVNLALDNILT